jgi:hypothetical protein
VKPLSKNSTVCIQWSCEGLFVCDTNDAESGVNLSMRDLEALLPEIQHVLALPVGAVIDPGDMEGCLLESRGDSETNPQSAKGRQDD